MSRSRKKVSFPTIGARTARWWKHNTNKRLRAKVRIALRGDWDSLLMPTKEEAGNIYDSPKDGLGPEFFSRRSWDNYRQMWFPRVDWYAKGFRK